MDARRPWLETEALYDISKVLSLSSDLSKAYTSSITILRLYLGLENGTLSLFDPVTQEVFIEAAPEMRDEERILGRLRPGEGVVGRIFKTGMPVVVPDMAEEPLFLGRTGSWKDLETDRRAFVGVPVRDARAVLGVLAADRPHRSGPHRYDRDVRFLTVVATMIATRVRLGQLESPHQRAVQDVPALQPDAERFPAVVGRSAGLREVLGLVARVAPSRATVLLRGESGTGKELVARAIHDHSPRAERPFVIVNCAAIPETLIESELFGHEKGAFTGAVAARAGKFEQADGGTLFLDEVGELSPAAQAKLLRVVQERQFERVGGRRPVTVDVRLVAATNRDLETMVKDGSFRLDLYHRLSVVTVTLPPLRERPDDVAALAEHFLRELNEENGRRATLSAGAVDVLSDCRWSGNVRQLRNCLERVLVGTDGHVIAQGDLPCQDARGSRCNMETCVPLRGPGSPGMELAAGAAASSSTSNPAASSTGSTAVASDEEAARVRAALERCGWVQAKAARLLGMTVRQLGYRVRKHGIELQRL